jgi:ADP-heptose:LPS heptosyltransferase
VSVSTFTRNLKPKLLVIQLWRMGDLIIATPFLRAACEKFSVTLVCMPAWQDMRERFWPEVNVIPFQAPWTAFKFSQKYRLYSWPWLKLFRLRNQIGRERFDVGLSARWDPRDHFFLAMAGVKQRLGFPRMGSQMFLTRPLKRPHPEAHVFEYWRILAQALELDLPSREKTPVPGAVTQRETILVHTGANQPVRVWPLERYRNMVLRLRSKGYRVQVACDPQQREWWLNVGEKNVIVPRTIKELIGTVDNAAVFIGNDSGPGHLAAIAGVPTFTVFGPQLPEWFAPLHPDSEWMEGGPCPYKPCSDYCFFPSPHCLLTITEGDVWQRVEKFVMRHVPLHLAIRS